MLIREIIKEQDISTKELADRLNISISGLNQHLAGNPSLKVLNSIAEALNVPLWRLFVRPEQIAAESASHDDSFDVCPHCGKPIVIEATIKKP